MIRVDYSVAGHRMLMFANSNDMILSVESTQGKMREYFFYNLVSHQRNEMILEIAPLQIRPGQSKAFEVAFLKAQAIISAMPGYISHELQRCLERGDCYVLLVRWENVEAHELGFRQSPQYQQWKQLLHHFYDPFPTVLHYEQVSQAAP